MAEDLTPADVESYTNGRLLASDAEVQRALNAALARIRRYCGWHVSPVRTETLTVDGPDEPDGHWGHYGRYGHYGSGSQYLVLKTMHIVNLISITEHDEPTDLANVKKSADAPGILYKKRCPWACGFSAIEVELEHGYTAAEAEDFREAVLALVDRASQSVGDAGGGAQLVEKEVDDVRYRWSDKVISLTLDESAVGQFRILPI